MPPEKKDVILKEGEIPVKESVLNELLVRVAKAEETAENAKSKAAGLEELWSADKGADTTGTQKLRERRNFEPAFRTVSVKKYPIGGDVNDMGYVIGWDQRGAYQKVDKTGIAPMVVDYINVFFLGKERNAEGKLQAEAVTLLSLINAEEVSCKILDTKIQTRKEPTGETIQISTWDPKHGLVQTGDEIDGWVGFSDREFVIQIPDVAEPVTIDEKYVNI